MAGELDKTIQEMVSGAAQKAAIAALSPAKPGETTTENKHVGSQNFHALLGSLGSLLAALGSAGLNLPEYVPYFVALASLMVIAQCVTNCMYIWSRTAVKRAAIIAGKTVAILALVLLLPGCRYQEAGKTSNRAQISLEEYRRQLQLGIEKLHDKIRQELRAAADRNYSEAVASITDPQGKANAQALEALQNVRLEKYELIEQEIAKSRAYFSGADVNASNALQDLELLQTYFQKASNNSEAIERNSNEFLKMLQDLRTKPKPK